MHVLNGLSSDAHAFPMQGCLSKLHPSADLSFLVWFSSVNDFLNGLSSDALASSDVWVSL